VVERQTIADVDVRPNVHQGEAWSTVDYGPARLDFSIGPRGIFFACYAPWMRRISALTNDTFLHDIARSATIGRYTSFPGYHLNTARTTAHEKPDFARRGKDELNSATSIHYNHIWPHIALVLDYLVSDAFAKSRGVVDFPSRYAEGYGYLQQKVYGDRAGRVYDLESAYRWMPRGVVEVSHPELNYIVARADDAVAIVLTNQSKSTVRSKVRLNPDLVHFNTGAKAARVTLWENNIATRNTGLGAGGEVEVRPEGIAAVAVRGVAPQVAFQRAVPGHAGGKRVGSRLAGSKGRCNFIRPAGTHDGLCVPARFRAGNCSLHPSVAAGRRGNAHRHRR